MAQIFKDTTQVEVKCSEDIFEVYTSKPHLFPKICPDKIQNCDLIEGDGKTVGSLKFWKFVPVLGKTETTKEKIEAIDLINKKVTKTFNEGTLSNYYKEFKATIEIITENGKTFAKLSIEYEKLNDTVPAPTQYLDFFHVCCKDIDSYFSKP